MPGDVVRRLIEGQENQRGFVCDTTVTCHVQLLGQNRVICNVDSHHLRSIQVCLPILFDLGWKLMFAVSRAAIMEKTVLNIHGCSIVLA